MTVGREPTAIGPLRILIVEDDTLVGMGLRSQLERLGHEVVGQASSRKIPTWCCWTSGWMASMGSIWPNR
jgi:hypothetical protein